MKKSEDGKKPTRPSLKNKGKVIARRTIERSQVRQSFSHGRTRSVTVEMRRRVVSPAQVKDSPDTENTDSPDKESDQTHQSPSSENVNSKQANENLHTEQGGGSPLKDNNFLPQTGKSLASKDSPVTKKHPIKKEVTEKKVSGQKGEKKRRDGKLTISKVLDSDEERVRSLAAVKRARAKQRQQEEKKQFTQPAEVKKQSREVIVPENITVGDLANRMAEPAANLIKSLIKMGVMATINDTVEADAAEILVHEFGHKLKRVRDSDVEIGLIGEDQEKDLIPRPPVVTVMGHVDHGKTTLLDALRKTDIAAKEHGGITQHIGAYQILTKSGKQVTFLDTPGHEAFSSLRMRGASITDVVILVVAADDGVKDQTIEAINHAKAAKVPIIVAINKIDLPAADSQRVKNDLLQHGLIVEEMGGDCLSVEISAKDKTNFDKLEEAIFLQSDLLELKSNPSAAASGIVVEAKLEKGKGPVATVLVKRGTLQSGDIVVAGSQWGKIRSLVDDRGKLVDKATPSAPVELIGLTATPTAGDDFVVVNNEAKAREISDYRKNKLKLVAKSKKKINTEQIFSSDKKNQLFKIPVILKADVNGSLEAVVSSISKLFTEEVEIEFMHTGVGGINESDVSLACASQAIIFGFNVRPNSQASALAKKEEIEIKFYSLIHELIEGAKDLMSGKLTPDIKENSLGSLEIKEVFSISKLGKIAGCVVANGIVKKESKVRILRDQVLIHEGAISSLKHFKNEVKEVKVGQECGISIHNYQDIKVGDIVECYELQEVERRI
jgi:translation initiation factor IF-2